MLRLLADMDPIREEAEGCVLPVLGLVLDEDDSDTVCVAEECGRVGAVMAGDDPSTVEVELL